MMATLSGLVPSGMLFGSPKLKLYTAKSLGNRPCKWHAIWRRLCILQYFACRQCDSHICRSTYCRTSYLGATTSTGATCLHKRIFGFSISQVSQAGGIDGKQHTNAQVPPKQQQMVSCTELRSAWGLLKQWFWLIKYWQCCKHIMINSCKSHPANHTMVGRFSSWSSSWKIRSMAWHWCPSRYTYTHAMRTA